MCPAIKNGNLTPDGVTMIQEAVAKERQRVRPKKVKEPDTELGREIKKVTDAPIRMICPNKFPPQEYQRLILRQGSAFQDPIRGVVPGQNGASAINCW